MRMSRLAIGLDIGGTKIAAGVVRDDGVVLDGLVTPTPPYPAPSDATLDELRSCVRSLLDRYPSVEAVGVGAAGMVDWPSGHIRFAPNNAYCGLDLRDLLLAEFGLPTVVENDANAAAVAEARFGQGRERGGVTNLVVLTLGTGIGGGIVLDGQLCRGSTGIGAEVGHIVVSPRTGPSCKCGARGCLEVMASGTALGRTGCRAARQDPSGLMAQLAGSADVVTGETVFAAARQGDRVAHRVVEELGFWLGVGIASLVNIFDPELVVLAGGMGVAGADILLSCTQAPYESYLMGRHHRTPPDIVPATLGLDAGIIGAASLALDDHPVLCPAT